MNLDKRLSDYGDDELITSAAMASLFSGTNAQTWAALRHKGSGPVFVKVMRRVYYRRRDVETWLNGNRWERTDLPASSSAPSAS
jgi:hypothetical protein